MVGENDELWNYMNSIKHALAEMNSINIFMGDLLNRIKQEGLYKLYGNEVKYWNQFLDMIGLSVSEAAHYISMWKELPNSASYPISPFRLRKAVRTAVQANVPIEELLTIAEDAPHKDFNDHINTLLGKKSYLECQHEEAETFQKCKTCGKWFKEGTHCQQAEGQTG